MLVGASDHSRREVFDELKIVGGHQHSVSVGCKFVEESHNLVAGLGVKVAGGLIGKYEVRAIEKRAGDDDALLLAAAEFMGHLVALVRHTHIFQHLFDAFFDFCFFLPSCGLEHKSEVGCYRAVLKQLEILKHNPYLASEIWDFRPLQFEQVEIHDSRLFGIAYGHIGIHRLHQRRFAASYPSDEIAEFTLAQSEVNIFEHLALGALNLCSFIFHKHFAGGLGYIFSFQSLEVGVGGLVDGV